MKGHCEECAGCCIDWRSLSPIELDHERRDEWEPIDDHYNFVSLTRDDVEEFTRAGLTDALTPRLWYDRTDCAPVTIDGTPIASIDGKPVFFLGLRKVSQPVNPFGNPRTWLPTCVFLDPTTLQCRIHDLDQYPTNCREYPAHNLYLEIETECERVERAGGGDRLINRSVSELPPGLVLGLQAIGYKVFVHPELERYTGVIEHLQTNLLTSVERASFIAAALASSPGSTDHEMDRYRSILETIAATSSWVSDMISYWQQLAGTTGEAVVDPITDIVYENDDVPGTPGW